MQTVPRESTVRHAPVPVAELPTAPQTQPPVFVVDASEAWGSQQLSEVWRYRELLYFLVWRNVKARYKQTALGVMWVVLQPLLMAALLSVIFGVFAGVPATGLPYPLLVFAALLPWQLFAHALASSHSLVTDQQLISKVYFPRLLVPVAAVLAGALDFLITLVVLFVLLLLFGVPLTSSVLWLPGFILLALGASVGVALWLSALNARYRDVQYAVPFLTQVWLLATPVAYVTELVPPPWRVLYALNPLVGVVDGFRWSLLGQTPALSYSPWIAAAVIAALLVSGVVYFAHVEATVADVI